MCIGLDQTFIKDRRGSVAVEFVALLPAFVFLTFFIFEIGIAVLWIGTAEKAAQLGARLAIVSSKAVTDLPATYSLAADHTWGQNCSQGACGTGGSGFPARWCIGGLSGGAGGYCDTANCTGATKPCFGVIVDRMRAIAPLIQPQNVTISYEYAGLGFAGGPIVPRVTVTVGVTPAGFTPPNAGQAVPYGTFMTTILARFMRLVTGNPAAGSPLTNMPTISATFTGEDLSTAGAS
jgi:hypothetical protein